jgi:hypothetical protein
VALDGGDVEVFGCGVEEGHCWGVDAGQEGTASARVAVCPIGGGVVDSIGLRHGSGERMETIVLWSVRGEWRGSAWR